jgi:hypothetical protein
MPKRTDSDPNKMILVIAISLLVVILAALGLWYAKGQKKDTAKTAPQNVSMPVKVQQVIDYSKIEKEGDLKDLMDQRKEDLGVGEGIDIIAKSDESLKIGDSTVPMSDIIEKIQLKIGDIVEKNIASGDSDPNQPIKDFGIYVVQPGDNIWDVHFRFLKDYFARKGISLSPNSDEPDTRGASSGVGKILKFSENIVHIYSVEKRSLDINLGMIHPLTKLVIYNMDRIFALLDQIDYNKVDLINFDGETLWVPAEG